MSRKEFVVGAVVEFVPGPMGCDRGCWTQGIYHGPTDGRHGWHDVWSPKHGELEVPSRRLRKPRTP